MGQKKGRKRSVQDEDRTGLDGRRIRPDRTGGGGDRAGQKEDKTRQNRSRTGQGKRKMTGQSTTGGGRVRMGTEGQQDRVGTKRTIKELITSVRCAQFSKKQDVNSSV